MGDYCGPKMHGFLLDKIMVYTDHIETKTTASYELSIGKAVGLMIAKLLTKNSDQK
jgi:hypothetical protein